MDITDGQIFLEKWNSKFAMVSQQFFTSNFVETVLGVTKEVKWNLPAVVNSVENWEDKGGYTFHWEGPTWARICRVQELCTMANFQKYCPNIPNLN